MATINSITVNPLLDSAPAFVERGSDRWAVTADLAEERSFAAANRYLLREAESCHATSSILLHFRRLC